MEPKNDDDIMDATDALLAMLGSMADRADRADRSVRILGDAEGTGDAVRSLSMLLGATQAGDTIGLPVRDRATGERRLMVAGAVVQEDGQTRVIPFGILFDRTGGDDPFDLFEPIDSRATLCRPGESLADAQARQRREAADDLAERFGSDDLCQACGEGDEFDHTDCEEA